jgi:predicted O-methyltransferase YrrM
MPVHPSDYKLKVLLGIPFAGGSRYVPPEWAIALATIAWPMNCRYAYCPVKGMVREEARTEICNRAISHRAQYVAMLDDDVQPGADWVQALTRELDSRPEFDVICGVVASPNREPMIFAQPEMGPFWQWKKGDVFEIAECATACIMFRTSLLDRIPKPWFRDLNTIEERVAEGTIAGGEADRGAMTDDIYFCRKALAAGARILAHGGVLPIHWNRKGEFAELQPDSYPFRSTTPVSNGHANGRVDITRALDIQGWMTQDELTWLANEASRVQVKRIAEIGCWMGRSTRALVDNIAPDGVVFAVDTWKGSGEHQEQVNGMGEDWVLDQFRVNLQDRSDRLEAVQLASVEAAALARADGQMFDFIFIDAAHDYANVKADIEAWRLLVKPGGILAGHDYEQAWPGVIDAVNELLPGARRGAGSIWYDVIQEGD